LKVGVVGCGYWGSKHARVLHSIPQVEQVIAIDPRQERLRALHQALPSLAMYQNLQAALDQVDAVVIATPPRTHAGLALAAMAAGKSVLVEKPLAMSTTEAELMIEEASARSLTLMVGHTFEYNAAVWKLRELVQSGELGRIYYMDSARLNLGLYQHDVNVVWDLAPHDISIYNYVLGSSPVSVQAWGSRHGYQHLEDVAYLRLLYANPDVTANVHVSWLDPCKVRRTTVVGSAKMAVYNDLAPNERIRVFDKGVVPPENGANLQDYPMSYRYGEIRSPYVAFDEPLYVQDREFVSCVLTGRQPPTHGYNGLAVTRVLECAELSLQTGGPVELDQVAQPDSREPKLATVV
jgi:predicted dehydrogenase